MQAIYINWVNPKTLVPNEVASNTFSVLPPNFESIKDSIAKTGILEPLIVEGNKVISGNLRLKIALELGMEKIPVQETITSVENTALSTYHHAQQRIKSPQELLLESRLLKEQFPIGQGCRTDLNTDKQKNKEVRNKLDKFKNRIYKLEKIDKLAKNLYGEGSSEYLKNWEQINKGQKSINAALTYLERCFNIKKNAESIPDVVEKNTETYKLFNKSCESMSELKEKSIACIFCSPPYYGMIDYGTGKEQRGMEKNIESYIDGLVNDMSDCWRVLKDEGSLWVNIGEGVIKGKYNLAPAQLALALIKRGWILNDEWIWIKHNPNFTRYNRSVRNHESIFHFVKSKDFYYDDTLVYSLTNPDKKIIYGTKTMNLLSAIDVRGNVVKTNGNNMQALKNRCNEEGFTLTHSAGFPITIPLLGILATSRIGDTVLDVYSGTASVGEAAIRSGRSYVGYELKPEYVEGAIVRLKMTEEDMNNMSQAA